MIARLYIAISLLLFLAIKAGSLTITTDVERKDGPVDESENAGDNDQAVKGSINSLNLNEKVEIDDKNPTLKELQKKIEETLKKKKKEMKEEEEKKSDDKVVNLKPTKNENCKDTDESKTSKSKGKEESNDEKD